LLDKVKFWDKDNEEGRDRRRRKKAKGFIPERGMEYCLEEISRKKKKKLKKKEGSRNQEKRKKRKEKKRKEKNGGELGGGLTVAFQPRNSTAIVGRKMWEKEGKLKKKRNRGTKRRREVATLLEAQGWVHRERGFEEEKRKVTDAPLCFCFSRFLFGKVVGYMFLFGKVVGCLAFFGSHQKNPSCFFRDKEGMENDHDRYLTVAKASHVLDRYLLKPK
jgi:hypothetical protein